MLCTRLQLAAGWLAFGLLMSSSAPSLGQATPAPIGGADEILPTGNGANTNADQAGTNRPNRCVGIACLRLGEKEELYWLCSTLAEQGIAVDDKALCTDIGQWKAAQQLGGP